MILGGPIYNRVTTTKQRVPTTSNESSSTTSSAASEQSQQQADGTLFSLLLRKSPNANGDGAAAQWSVTQQGCCM